VLRWGLLISVDNVEQVTGVSVDDLRVGYLSPSPSGSF